VVDLPGAVAAPAPAASRPVDRVVALLRFVLHDRALLTASILLGILLFLAIFGPLIWRKDPLAVNLLSALQPPSREHPMGTDNLGRDVFARFNEGARISLIVGIAVVTTGALVGGTLGLVAGVFGGWLDAVFMRVMDAMLAFPPLILAMAVTVGLGVGLKTAALGIMLTSVPYYARLIRSDVLRIRSLPFVEAAAALGASRTRIILRHIAPHTVSTLFIQASAVFGYAILTLAALGFIGLGAQVPTPEWGTMITEGLANALTGQWWTGVFPGLGVLAAVTAASIIADRARDILDPRGDYAHV
jgi:peptide/nickel transport system permease protein